MKNDHRGLERELPRTDLSRRGALTQLASILAGACGAHWLKTLSPEALLAEGTQLHRHVASGQVKGPTETSAKLLFFNPHQFKTVDALCEMVIPQTETAGARAAKVPQFIDLLLAERETQMQGGIAAGLKWLDRRSLELFGKNFVDATVPQQLDLLTRISSPGSSEPTLGQVFFNQIKNLTVFGYYTSKEGLEQELGYAGPQGIGTYEGSVPVQKR
ncbi:MAG TPA: gluconate 2-dehydrogenase subunit 3 family protein [Terriglobia bacterium]|nr:gluconate 2-dehydrogenase subunit 3 family protein [Terriglobia bacterium]